MAPYRYKRLNEAAKEIRLLTLLAGKFSDHIHISIQTTQFQANGSSEDPKFEALSYTWGSTDDPVDINIHNGLAKPRTLAITRNLATALPYLRYEDRDRVLWVDAICVNQRDQDERSNQVQRMADIYSRAELVVAWLGSDYEDCGQALQLLGSLSSRIEVDWIKSTIEPVTEDDRDWADDTKLLPYSTAEYSAMYRLFQRSWFERIWIRQEIQLAKAAVLACGSSVISWTSFRKAILCLRNKGGWENIRGVAERVEFLVNLTVYGNAYESLGSLIYSARHCKCDDPKDRVYGVLGLLHEYDKERWAFQPDYTKTICQTYEDVTFSYMKAYNSLRLLQHCDFENRNPELALPSWVPDWGSMGNAAEPTDIGIADCSWPGQYHRFERDGCSVLEAKGVKIDSIVDVLGLHIVGSGDSFWTDVANFQRVATCSTLTNMYVGNRKLLDALCRTLVMGAFRELYDPSLADLVSEEDGKLAFSKFIGGPSKYSEDDILDDREAQRYLTAVFVCARNRSLIFTRAGRIGLAPRATRPGDRVCVLLGCANPLVIRPVGACSAQFQVVGAAYIDSMMSGEALLGPLPNHYRHILKYDRELRYYRHAFLNSQTLETQWEDPRWKCLLGEDYEEGLDFKSRVENGKESLLRTKVLEARGIELRMFEFV